LESFLRLRSCSKIFQSGSGNFSNLRIRLGCSDFGYKRCNRKLTMVLQEKWPQRLLLLPKLKSDSGSERKTQNPARVNSGSVATYGLELSRSSFFVHSTAKPSFVSFKAEMAFACLFKRCVCTISSLPLCFLRSRQGR